MIITNGGNIRVQQKFYNKVRKNVSVIFDEDYLTNLDILDIG